MPTRHLAQLKRSTNEKAVGLVINGSARDFPNYYRVSYYETILGAFF